MPVKLIFWKNIWEDVKPYLRPEGIAAIEEKGKSITDFENERVTPLIGNEECAYTYLKIIFLCVELNRHGPMGKLISKTFIVPSVSCTHKIFF